MKKIFTEKMIEFLKTSDDNNRYQLQIELNTIIKNLKLSFENVEAELMAKNHLLSEINNYAISPNNIAKGHLITQLTLFPSIIVE